ncbi:MAG: hypothetical protein LBM28_06760 [Oscillospiraceae bacterium]|jgi:hypothetical protein|nr:hypothetical protein [Oscillospiraceae bacterium]
MLNNIRRQAQSGANSVRAVFDKAQSPAFRSALRQQLQEYDRIYAEADMLLAARQGKRSDISQVRKYASSLSSKLRLLGSSDTTSAIAQMMLRGSARGLREGMQNSRKIAVLDPKVSSLSNRLLQSTQANIEQMQQFL